MSSNLLFWFGVWFMMLAAFTTAWTFIVKGCEAIDENEAGDIPAEEHH